MQLKLSIMSSNWRICSLHIFTYLYSLHPNSSFRALILNSPPRPTKSCCTTKRSCSTMEISGRLKYQRTYVQTTCTDRGSDVYADVPLATRNTNIQDERMYSWNDNMKLINNLTFIVEPANLLFKSVHCGVTHKYHQILPSVSQIIHLFFFNYVTKLV